MKLVKSLFKTIRYNTIKTGIGYLYSLLERVTPFSLSKPSIDGIYNYLPIDDRISTSGQPTEIQFKAIQAAGFSQVINLAPHDAENSLADEAAVVENLDIRYHHIPVDFMHPSNFDFADFCAVMDALKNQKVWIHCAANMRVSAFMYRYRCAILKADQADAQRDLDKIWQPFGVWREFIKNVPNDENDQSNNRTESKT
jgi:protein tyrosine phosphatase (PTP) superfamily phosphohydrolase (DUF442 family)